MVPPLHEPSDLHVSALPRDPEARLRPGTRVLDGRIEIVAELARGGMGVVYEAIDHGDAQRRVALKVVTEAASRPETMARFQNEARLAQGLANHPGIAAPLGVGQLDGPEGFEGRAFLVTELVHGESLAAVMSRHRTGLPQRRALAIARDVAHVLADLHERGIVHRDIKPGNVMVSGDGELDEVHLIDFGLAYATGDGWEAQSPDLTAEGHAPGTALYMSAEQAAHLRPAPPMDVYSLGIMLYELLAGDPPFHGMGIGEMFAHKCDRTRRPYPIEKICDGLPKIVATLVDRCLRFDPAERPSADGFAATLDAVLTAPSLRVVEHTDDTDDGEPTVARSGEVEQEQRAAGSEDEAPGDETPVEEERDTADVHSPRSRTWMAAVLGVVVVALGLALLIPHEDASETTAPSSLLAPAAAATTAVAEGFADESSGSPDTSSSGHDRAVGNGTSGRAGIDATTSGSVPTSNDDSADEPPLPVPAPKPRPSATIDVERCATQVQDARDAAMREEWPQVLRLTKKATCFQSDPTLRLKLRAKALLETRSYRECVAVGRRSKDAALQRIVRMCEAEAARENTPP